MLSPQRYLPGTDRVFWKESASTGNKPPYRSPASARKNRPFGRQGGRMITPDDPSGDETTGPYANNQHGVID